MSSLRINQNVLSIRTHGSLSKTSERLDKSIAKLSSGLRINNAADDAAGLAISEKMRRSIKGLSRAILNAQDGISMIQAGEGALDETHSILQRMRELAIQASNDTLTSNDRLEIQKEIVQLRDDLNRISNNTEFNTKKLLDGSQSMMFSASSNSVEGLVTGTGAMSGDYAVSITLLKGGITEMQRSQIFTLKGDYNSLAQGGTQLQSIAQFYDANGVFALDTPLSLNISGNSKSTSIVLDGQMTLDKLAAGIQNALVSASGLQVDNSRVGTITTAASGIAGLGGYIEVVSGAIGDLGKISFAGDQKLMDAMGFGVNRVAVNNLVEVTMRDSFGNMRQVRTDSSRAVGLLNGVDVAFTSQAAQMAGTKGLEEGLKITSANTMTLNVAGGQLGITIDDGSWTMEGLARSINYQIDQAISGQVTISDIDPAGADANYDRTIEGWKSIRGVADLEYVVSINGAEFRYVGLAGDDGDAVGTALAALIDADAAYAATYDAASGEMRITEGAGLVANIAYYVQMDTAGAASDDPVVADNAGDRVISTWDNLVVEPGLQMTVNVGGTDFTYLMKDGDNAYDVGEAIANLIDQDAGYAATWDSVLGEVRIAGKAGTAVTFSYELGEPRLDGLSAAVVDGQIRLSYEKPATASTTVSTTIRISNATGNANEVGFIDGDYNGFVDGKKDLSKVEWGFSIYRTASDTARMYIGDGQNIHNFAAFTTVTAQTDADMQGFIQFQSMVNKELSDANIAVRVDQVGGTLAFTSLRVGREHIDGGGTQESMVTTSYLFDNSGVSNLSNEWAWEMFELSEGARKGSGDKNFRLHVVDNTPQFQVGSDQGQTMKVAFGDMSARALGVENLDMTSVAAADKSLALINKAVDKVSAERSKLGAFQNRLEYAINNLRNTHTNMVSAESRIRDADIAEEMIEFTRNQIVAQSGTAMLAQANLVPQGVLQLLR